MNDPILTILRPHLERLSPPTLIRLVRFLGGMSVFLSGLMVVLAVFMTFLASVSGKWVLIIYSPVFLALTPVIFARALQEYREAMEQIGSDV